MNPHHNLTRTTQLTKLFLVILLVSLFSRETIAQSVVISGPPPAGNQATVDGTAPSGSEFGLTTRNIPRKKGSILTIVPLTNGSTYTQSWVDTQTDGVTYTTIQVFTDKASATNGLVVQGSNDTTNSNLTTTISQVSISANTLYSNTILVPYRYFRIMYINGGTTETSLEITSTSSEVIPSSSINTQSQSSILGGTNTYLFAGGTGNAQLTNTVVQVGATAAHSLYGIDFINTGTNPVYIQIFDLASGSVTLGTTVPKIVKWVPAGGAWEEKWTGENKIAFFTALSFAATSTTTGSGSPSASLLGNVEFN